MTYVDFPQLTQTATGEVAWYVTTNHDCPVLDSLAFLSGYSLADLKLLYKLRQGSKPLLWVSLLGKNADGALVEPKNEEYSRFYIGFDYDVVLGKVGMSGLPTPYISTPESNFTLRFPFMCHALALHMGELEKDFISLSLFNDQPQEEAFTTPPMSFFLFEHGKVGPT